MSRKLKNSCRLKKLRWLKQNSGRLNSASSHGSMNGSLQNVPQDRSFFLSHVPVWQVCTGDVASMCAQPSDWSNFYRGRRKIAPRTHVHPLFNLGELHGLKSGYAFAKDDGVHKLQFPFDASTSLTRKS